MYVGKHRTRLHRYPLTLRGYIDTIEKGLEGDLSGIVMMIEFESKEAAHVFYHSEEYQAAKAVREECSDTDFMIIEGVTE